MKHFSKIALVLSIYSFCISHAKASALLSNAPILTLEGAKYIAAAAAKKAESENWKVVIVICDAGGHLKYLECMDDVQLGSIEIARQKAKTAVFYRRPTKAFYDRIKAGDTPVLALPDLQPFEGALPILVNGKVIGAIGISGLRGSQDAEVAQAGIDAFLEQIQ